MADDNATAPASAPSQPAPKAKTMRFKAPVDTSGITLSTGRVLAVGDDGLLTAPDDLTKVELDALQSQGFTAA